MEKILIVVDLQKDFISGVLGTIEAEMIVPKIKQMLDEVPEDTTVIFTKDTHCDNYLDTAEGHKLPVPHCIKDTEGWQIPDELTAPFLYSPFVIEKPTFGSLELMDYIHDIAADKDWNVELVFCGLCTDICVVSNTLMVKAHYPDINIAVDANCCAGVTPETHNAALTTMKMCQVDVLNFEN